MDWKESLYGDSTAATGPRDGGALIGRVLGELGVKYLFAINGGHTFPLLANLRNNGIKLIHMRHEQACAYAADAYARTSRTPGVCSVTAGCGLTNAITGLCGAALAGSAVVCIAGQHPTNEDHIGSFQEAYGADICRSFAKFAKRVVDSTTIEVDLRQAFREALNPPQGATLLEIPTNILYHGDDAAKQRRGAKVFAPDQLRSQGDPRQIERTVELLCRAERPLLLAGDGVFWSDAAAELQELAELASVPAYARRAAQGAIPEEHALAIRGSWKKPFTGRADLVIAVGFRFWSGEHFGEPPTWNDKATYVQIDPSVDRIAWHVPAEVGIVGDPKLVLRQLIDEVRRRKIDFSARRESSWVAEVAEVRSNYERTLDERERGTAGNRPTHPDRLARTLASMMDRDATLIVDSFTLSGWLTQWLPARFPGQIVDAGPLAPVGHGVGMAIGAQLARPGKQIVLVIGDGGLGIGGWDIETALRYDLPIVTVLWNNSSWGPSFEQMPMLRGRTDPFNMLDNIRYDKMFEVLGCHAEHVEEPSQLAPALERAFASGKASLLNVIGDKRIGHPRLGGNLLGSTRV
jgi:acetolactate synthase-1/2/3 large subunit